MHTLEPTHDRSKYQRVTYHKALAYLTSAAAQIRLLQDEERDTCEACQGSLIAASIAITESRRALRRWRGTDND